MGVKNSRVEEINSIKRGAGTKILQCERVFVGKRLLIYSKLIVFGGSQTCRGHFWSRAVSGLIQEKGNLN